MHVCIYVSDTGVKSTDPMKRLFYNSMGSNIGIHDFHHIELNETSKKYRIMS